MHIAIVRVAGARPLVVMTPKSLLRHKQAVSPVENLVTGRFQEVLDDNAGADQVRRVLVCSGKVYYDLIAKRVEFLTAPPRDNGAEVIPFEAATA